MAASSEGVLLHCYAPSPGGAVAPSARVALASLGRNRRRSHAAGYHSRVTESALAPAGWTRRQNPLHLGQSLRPHGRPCLIKPCLTKKGGPASPPSVQRLPVGR